MRILASVAILIGFLPSPPSQPAAATPVHGYRIVKVYPHDNSAFTQGLQFVDGLLYEGTGLNGRSEIRAVNLDTGAIVRRRAIPSQFFGEGIVVVGKELFQLTWTTGVGFVYSRDTFDQVRTFKYPGLG